MHGDLFKITRTPRFLKNYKARIQSIHLKKVVVESIRRFCEEKAAPELRDHELRYSMKKLRAFSVTDDIRIVYLQTKHGVIFLDIGTHEQVYRR